MNCPTCGLEQPQGIPHTTLDSCQIALVAAQDAVRLTIAEMQKEQDKLKPVLFSKPFFLKKEGD